MCTVCTVHKTGYYYLSGGQWGLWPLEEGDRGHRGRAELTSPSTPALWAAQRREMTRRQAEGNSGGLKQGKMWNCFKNKTKYFRVCQYDIDQSKRREIAKRASWRSDPKVWGLRALTEINFRLWERRSEISISWLKEIFKYYQEREGAIQRGSYHLIMWK